MARATVVVFLELMSGQGDTSKGSTGEDFLLLLFAVFLEGLESSGIHYAFFTKKRGGNMNINS